MFKKSRLIVMLTAFVLATSIGMVKANNYFEITKNLELFVNMLSELNANYVDDIDPEKLIRTGIDAMLESLDPYTNFIPEEDLSSYKLQTTGKYGGIGALIRQDDDYVIIAEPYQGFPAHKADLRAGDKIIKIGGVSAKGKTTGDVSKLLKGRPGTDTEITIERPGEANPMDISITREEIKIKSVPYYGLLNKDIGYIKLTKFTENCSKDVTDALNALKEQHNIKSLVLDLRFNPGGLLNEAIDVTNVFVPEKQLVVSTKGKTSDKEKLYRTYNKPVDTEIPLVVLINRGSASASEIVSGTIQDLDRGLVIGQRSFGKGLVQTTKNVGYNAKIKITTAKYYLPSGRCIQAIDYAGGYKDGADKIPDSLRTAYKTTKGRTVYDASGIDPDIEIDLPNWANITYSLTNKNIIFDFATQYRIKNKNIPKPDVFELSDADYADFVSFANTKDYSYTTQSENLLKDFKEKAEKEKYLDAIQNEMDELDNKIQSDKKNDLNRFKEEIKQLLEYEIVMRYYFQHGEIEERLEDDEAVKNALEILGNPNKYKSKLTK